MSNGVRCRGEQAFTVRDFVALVRSRSGVPLDDDFAQAVAKGVAMLNRPRVTSPELRTNDE